MKLIVSLFLVVALTLSGPRFCGHALIEPGVDSMTEHSMPAQTMSEKSMTHGDHAIMGHDMTHQDHDGSPDHANDCQKDCDGGFGCEGCRVVSLAMLTVAEGKLSTTLTTMLALRPNSALPIITLLDLPPPRRLF